MRQLLPSFMWIFGALTALASACGTSASPSSLSDARREPICDRDRPVEMGVWCHEVLDRRPGDWQHARLKATDGTAISVDFLTNLERTQDDYIRPTYTRSFVRDTWRASNVWINVQAPHLNGTQEVRAVFIRKSYPYSCLPMDCYVRELQLAHAGGGRYTGTLGASFVGTLNIVDDYRNSANPAENYRRETPYGFEELAIVVDGRWLEDPMSGEHDFKFRMDVIRSSHP